MPMMRRFGSSLTVIACLAFPLPATAQDTGETSFVINLRDAEIQEFSERVSEITGRTLILDPAVDGQVTVISSEPLDAEGVWQLFQSILQVQGYAALRSGAAWRIVPQAKVSQGVATMGNLDTVGGQDIITRQIVLDTLSASEAVTALRPFVAPFGTLQALASPNAIVITDSADNVARMQSLVAQLDQDKRGQVETIQLQFAKAPEVAEAIIQVVGNATQPGARPGPQISADGATNTLLVRGEPDQIADVRRLVAQLDRPPTVATTPLVPPPEMQTLTTIPLRFAKASTVAQAVQAVLAQASTQVVPLAEGAVPPPPVAGPRISADDRSNTLLVRASAPVLAEIRALVATLDIQQSGAISLATIPLQYGDATSIAAAIQATIGDPATALADGKFPARISADAQSNTIIIRADPVTVGEIRSLVSTLDRRQTEAVNLVTIPLRYGDASSIAAAIQATLDGSPDEGSVGADGAVLAKPPARVSADAQSNTLIVRADPVTVAEIRTLVTALDRPQAEAPSLVTIPLSNGDAATVAAAIQAIVADPAAEAAGRATPRVSGDPRSNTLIVRADPASIAQIRALAAQLDGVKPSNTAVVPLRFAEAANVAEALNAIGEGAANSPNIAVDERGNALLLRGDPLAVAELDRLARQLDQPGAAKVQDITRVYRLRHTDAEALADILQEIVGLEPAAKNPVARSLDSDRNSGDLVSGLATAGTDLNAPETPLAAPDPALVEDARARRAQNTDRNDTPPDIAIQPDPDSNAIVLRGAPRLVEQTVALIEELDRRRPQVLIEAAIVEITGAAGEQLGIQFGFGDAAPDTGLAGTSFSNVGVSLDNVLSVLGVPAANLLTEGLAAGISAGDEFGILLQALATSSNANLLSTPSLTTLDNQEAEIVVGQNVPFLTGSFTIDGNSADPFTTIQREDVGITLRVLPRVHEGDVVRLKVEQEVSSLIDANVVGAADLITNRRSINTTVLADNNETVVLGGLITDDQTTAERKVPLLGDIPVAGRLFRSDTVGRTKRTLFVFLRPTILRDRTTVARVSREKYERLRRSETIPTTVPSLLITPPPLVPLPLEIDGLY